MHRSEIYICLNVVYHACRNTVLLLNNLIVLDHAFTRYPVCWFPDESFIQIIYSTFVCVIFVSPGLNAILISYLSINLGFS